MPFQRGEYPRLYFSRQDLPALRAKAKAGLRAEALATLTKFCDGMLDPRDPSYVDYKELNSGFWRKREGRWVIEPSLSSLSIAYAFTGNKRYGEAARDMFFAILDHKLADDPHEMAGHGVTKGWRHGPGHDKAMYAWAISHVFDMCQDLFSVEQRKRFVQHVIENIELAKLHTGDDYRNWPNNRGSRATVCCFGIYWLLLEGEHGLDEEYLDIAIHAAEVYLHTAMDQDGVNYEGPSYGSPSVIAEFAWMLRRSGRPNLLRNRRFARYLDAVLYELQPLDNGDANLLNDAEPNACAVAPGVLLDPKPAILPWLLRQLDLHPKRLTHFANPTRAELGTVIYPYPYLLHYILLNWDDALPVRTPRELGYPLSRCFPQRGIADMRTGWGAEDYLVSHFCGYEMHTEHYQSDFNHISFYALGEHFLVDEGYGQLGIPDTKENHRYFSRGDLHNTVLYSDGPMNGNAAHGGWRQWAEGRIIDWRHTPAFDTSLGDAAGCYGRDHTIDKALRRIVFVRDAAHPFMVVIDTMRVDADEGEHTFEALWRTHQGNRIEADGREFTIGGKHNDCYGTVLSPAGAELRVVNHYNLPQLRVKHRASVLDLATVFVPLRRGEKPPAFECERLGEGDFRIVVAQSGVKHILRAGTRTDGPLATPVPVEYVCQHA